MRRSRRTPPVLRSTRGGVALTLPAAAHTAWVDVHFGVTPLAWTTVALALVTGFLVFFRKVRFSR